MISVPYVTPDTSKDDYQPFCPHGRWRGCLDRKERRRDGNLFLYFTDIDTNLKWRLCAWERRGFRPVNGKLNLLTDVDVDDVLELDSIRATNGSPYLLDAQKIYHEDRE